MKSSVVRTSLSLVLGLGFFANYPAIAFADATAPSITSISVSYITSASAIVRWNTNEASNSQILYGTSTAYGKSIYDGNNVTSHRIQILGLEAGKTYHFRVRSKDTSGNVGSSADRVFTLANSSVPYSATYDLYLSPEGNDLNDGSEPQYAIKTLGRAEHILKTVNPSRNMEVRIKPGTYFQQTVMWNFTKSQYSISFLPTPEATTKPVFDGCSTSNVTNPSTQCLGETWFTLYSVRGEPSNIRLSNLAVQNYRTAVSLSGTQENVSSFNSGNTVENCRFYRIGNVFNPALRYSTAALRIVNSRNNKILNNEFDTVVNVKDYVYLHAIYMASYASNNTISGNAFKYTNGDPVRARDASSNNVISNNTFYRAGEKLIFEDWYCPEMGVSGCTKSRQECPSWNNVLSGNQVGTNYWNKPIPLYMVYLSDYVEGCPMPTSGTKRVVLR